MVRNRRSRSIVILVLLGALLDPLGHQLAYLLRYGPSQAARMEAVAPHTSLPRLASFPTITDLLALAPEAARVILALRLPRPARPIRLQPRPGLVTGAASRAPRQHPRRGPPLPV